LFTVTLFDGTALHVSGADRPITLNGVVYTSTGTMLERSTWKMTTTVEAQDMTLKFLSGNGPEFNFGGTNFKGLAINGGLRRSTIQVDRCFMPKTGVFGETAVGAVTYFRGVYDKSEVGATGGTLTYKSHSIRLVQQMPRNVYQPGCNNTLYDTACTVDRSSHSYSDVVGSGSLQTLLRWTTPPPDPTKFLLGTATITSGANSGSRATIVGEDAAGIIIMPPLPYQPQVGDAFTCVWGCDKTLATCSTKFNNAIHWRGFDQVPPEEFGA
jgi:hypothetical protein